MFFVFFLGGGGGGQDKLGAQKNEGLGGIEVHIYVQKSEGCRCCSLLDAICTRCIQETLSQSHKRFRNAWAVAQMLSLLA